MSPMENCKATSRDQKSRRWRDFPEKAMRAALEWQRSDAQEDLILSLSTSSLVAVGDECPVETFKATSRDQKSRRWRDFPEKAMRATLEWQRSGAR